MADHTPDRIEPPTGMAAFARRLLEDAGRIVADLPEPYLRAPMLARISALHNDYDRELAAREAGEAMTLAGAIDDPYVRSFTLAQISAASTAADPHRAASAARSAVRAAKTVADLGSRTVALAEAAKALGASDFARAMRVLAEAATLAESACSCLQSRRNTRCLTRYQRAADCLAAALPRRPSALICCAGTRCVRIASAVLRPIPGTSVSCSTVACCIA